MHAHPSTHLRSSIIIQAYFFLSPTTTHLGYVNLSNPIPLLQTPECGEKNQPPDPPSSPPAPPCRLVVVQELLGYHAKTDDRPTRPSKGPIKVQERAVLGIPGCIVSVFPRNSWEGFKILGVSYSVLRL